MDRAGSILEMGTISALAAHNVAIHRLPAPLDAALNLFAAYGLTAGARSNGFSWDELGMDPHNLGRGMALGTLAVAASVGVVAAAASLPATRPFFHDDRVVEVGRMEALYQTAVRIPLATALVEEVLFRGVLGAVLTRRRSMAAAGWLSSLLFGLWHVLPTLRTIKGNPKGQEVVGGIDAVSATVVATTIAGWGFWWLRRKSDSIAAPTLAHAAINISAYQFGRSVTKEQP